MTNLELLKNAGFTDVEILELKAKGFSLDLLYEKNIKLYGDIPKETIMECLISDKQIKIKNIPEKIKDKIGTIYYPDISYSDEAIHNHSLDIVDHTKSITVDTVEKDYNVDNTEYESYTEKHTDIKEEDNIAKIKQARIDKKERQSYLWVYGGCSPDNQKIFDYFDDNYSIETTVEKAPYACDYGYEYYIINKEYIEPCDKRDFARNTKKTFLVDNNKKVIRFTQPVLTKRSGLKYIKNRPRYLDGVTPHPNHGYFENYILLRDDNNINWAVKLDKSGEWGDDIHIKFFQNDKEYWGSFNNWVKENNC